MRQSENSLGHSQGSCSEWIQTVLLQCENGKYFYSSPTFSSFSLTHAHTDHLVSLTPAALTLACFPAPSLCFHSPNFTPDHLKLCSPYLKSTLMFEAEERGRREEKEEVKCERGWCRGLRNGGGWMKQTGGRRRDIEGRWGGMMGGEERRGREGGRERKKGNRDSRVQMSAEQMKRNETIQWDKNIYNETLWKTRLYKWHILTKAWLFFVVFVKLSLDVFPILSYNYINKAD